MKGDVFFSNSFVLNVFGQTGSVAIVAMVCPFSSLIRKISENFFNGKSIILGTLYYYDLSKSLPVFSLTSL